MTKNRMIAVAAVLASVTKADGKIQAEEVAAARSVLELLGSDNLEDAHRAYLEMLDDPDAEKVIEQLEFFAASSNMNERHELIRNCWYVAASDTEIHEKESELIFKFAEFLRVSREDCLLAKKSGSFG